MDTDTKLGMSLDELRGRGSGLSARRATRRSAPYPSYGGGRGRWDSAILGLSSSPSASLFRLVGGVLGAGPALLTNPPVRQRKGELRLDYAQ